MSEVEWFCVNNMANYYAIDEWKQYRLQDDLINDLTRNIQTRSFISQDEYIKRNQLYTIYYKKMLQERIKLIPELKETYESDLKRYTEQFNN